MSADIVVFIHSKRNIFSRPDAYCGQAVLVVGLGSTAADIACDLVGHASKIYLSHRRGNHVVSPSNVRDDSGAFA